VLSFVKISVVRKARWYPWIDQDPGLWGKEVFRMAEKQLFPYHLEACILPKYRQIANVLKVDQINSATACARLLSSIEALPSAQGTPRAPNRQHAKFVF
jgi:hypothetical protein